jgi:hypothetical protein
LLDPIYCDKVGKDLPVSDNVKKYYVPHPACPWWYRKTKKGAGKQQFIESLGNLKRAGLN